MVLPSPSRLVPIHQNPEDHNLNFSLPWKRRKPTNVVFTNRKTGRKLVYLKITANSFFGNLIFVFICRGESPYLKDETTFCMTSGSILSESIFVTPSFKSLKG
jgi:hypothetical protein